MILISKPSTLIIILLNLLALYYFFFIPIPTLQPLYSSLKSNLPGDTVQVKNVTAYFTNLSRNQVISIYQNTFKHPLSVKLNHPPEKAREIFTDTIQSYYLEEIVIPYKMSLFINGFEWQNDVFTPQTAREKNKLIYQNQTFSSKVSLRSFTPPPIFQYLTFLVHQIAFLTLISTIQNFRRYLK